MKKIFDSIKRWFVSPGFYLIAAVLGFTGAGLAFTWRIWSSVSPRYPINPAVWGQYGDFLCGTLGILFSLISVILVTKTFNGQQSSARAQRFNDLFFELLKLYQEQEKDLQYIDRSNNDFEIQANYKDFFDEIKKAITEQHVVTQSLSRNRKSAINEYTKTCIEFKSKLSLCYRSLYRMLDLINSSGLSSDEKGEYLKILRAQLTENELLCLRYHIKSGEYRKFAFLVNKYNLMKHLPLFNLLEFKYWWGDGKLNEIEIKRINEFFLELFRAIKQRPSSLEIPYVRNLIVVSIKCTKCSLRIQLRLKPDTNNATDALTAIYRFTDEEIENLLKCAVKEIVYFANFGCYNNVRELDYSSSHAFRDHNIRVYTVEVINKSDNTIHYSFDNSMKVEEIVSIN